MPMLRKDPISGRWVIIAAERAKRPRNYDHGPEDLRTDYCPFCAGNEEATPAPIATIGDGDGHGPWSVRVVPNKYPALGVEGGMDRRADGVYDLMNGVGAHEVIIEAPDHLSRVTQLDVARLTTVLRTWRDRMRDLRGDKRLRYAMVFKNEGEAAGATLAHVHSQLIALPVVPKRVGEELEGARRYHDFHERCVFCDIIDQERDQGQRLVDENADAVALTPFASRFPFEMWVLPRAHVQRFEDIDDGVLDNVAELLLCVLKKLDRALDRPPFNLMVHTAPLTDEDYGYYHWHFEIIPKLTRVAGFEWGTGFYINSTAPETAAEHLRDIDIDL